MYQLEERILFDGAAAVDLAVAQQEQQAQETQSQTDAQPQTQPDSATTSAAQNQTQTPNETAPVLPADTISTVPTTDAASTDTTSASLSAPIDASNPGQPANTHVNVLVVSESIENADELFKSANSDTIIVHYNEKTTTGAELLKEITDALHGEKADSIGFVTDKAHDGALKIFADGDTSENTISSESQQKFWNGVEGLLAEKGKVNIFASDLASTEAGRHLVDSIANITDHQVAASADVTGDKDAGGNWELEYVSKGTSSVDLIEEYFNRESIQSFDHRIEKPTEIAFIDSSVRDIDTILKGIGDQAEIVYLNKDHAFEQITSYLQGRTEVDAVHLISDGTSGEFYLGNETVNSDFINAHKTELAAWGKAMAADGDIHIYGCDLAKDQVGKDFTNQISVITGADVAASVDRTGVAGNWNLEFTTGEIQTAGFVIGDYVYNLKTLTVKRLDDFLIPDNALGINEANLTLREAVYIAANGDNISFADYSVLHSVSSTTPDPDFVKYGAVYSSNIYYFDDAGNRYEGLIDTLTIRTNITIDGNIVTPYTTPVNNSVILDAGERALHEPGKTFRAIYIDSQATVAPTTGAITGVSLNNMIIKNGLSLSTDSAPSAGSGGGIYVSSVSSLTLQTLPVPTGATIATVQGSTATYGGGIFNAGTFNLSGSVSGNHASYGGGVFNAGTMNGTGTGSVSGNNIASAHGGGIYNDGILNITGSGPDSPFSVDSNHASNGNGGGIYSNTGDISLTYVSIDSNEALLGNGGGIYIFSNYEQSTPMHFTSIEVDSNKAIDGAGIYLTNANPTSSATNVFELEWSDVTNNIATGNGGGIALFNNAGNIAIQTVFGTASSYNTQSNISYNYAVNGAGVYIENCANVTMDFIKMTYNGNAAGIPITVSGGAIYVKDSGKITLTDMEITYNYASSLGGGIYYTNSNTTGSLTVQSSNISHNDALFGGGIYQANGTLDLINDTLSFNGNAGTHGGAIYMDYGTLNVSLSTIAYNRGIGAAIYIHGNDAGKSNLTVGNTIIYNLDSNLFDSQIYLPVYNADLTLSQRGTISFSTTTNLYSHYGVDKAYLGGGNSLADVLGNRDTSLTVADRMFGGIKFSAKSEAIEQNLYLDDTLMYAANYRTMALAILSQNSWAIGSGSGGNTYDQRGNARGTTWTWNQTTQAWTKGSGYTIGAFEPIFHTEVNSNGDDSQLWYTGDENAHYFDKAMTGTGTGLTLREAIYWIDTRATLKTYLDPVTGLNPFITTDSVTLLPENLPYESRYVGFNSTYFAVPVGSTNPNNTIQLKYGQIEIGGRWNNWDSTDTNRDIAVGYMIRTPGTSGNIDHSDNTLREKFSNPDTFTNNPNRITVLAGDSGNTTAVNRLFMNTYGSALELNNLTISGGVGEIDLTQNSGSTNGGGIWNQGDLTLLNMVVQNSSSTGGATPGTGGKGGGVYNIGTAYVYDSSILNNTATATVSTTLRNPDAGKGGGIWNSGTMTIDRSQINGNTATGTSDGTNNTVLSMAGGGIFNSATLTIERSEISANKVSGTTIAKNAVKGAGIYNFVGATLNIANCTIAENTLDTNNVKIDYSKLGANPYVWGSYGSGIYNDGKIISYYNTIVNNKALVSDTTTFTINPATLKPAMLDSLAAFYNNSNTGTVNSSGGFNVNGAVNTDFTYAINTGFTGNINTGFTGNINTDFVVNVNTDFAVDVNTDFAVDVNTDFTGSINTDFTIDVNNNFTGAASAGYLAGSTDTISVKNFSGVFLTGSYITIGADPAYKVLSSSGGETPTSITLNRVLDSDVLVDDLIISNGYASGTTVLTVNNFSGTTPITIGNNVNISGNLYEIAGIGGAADNPTSITIKSGLLTDVSGAALISDAGYAAGVTKISVDGFIGTGILSDITAGNNIRIGGNLYKISTIEGGANPTSITLSTGLLGNVNDDAIISGAGYAAGVTKISVDGYAGTAPIFVGSNITIGADPTLYEVASITGTDTNPTSITLKTGILNAVNDNDTMTGVGYAAGVTKISVDGYAGTAPIYVGSNITIGADPTLYEVTAITGTDTNPSSLTLKTGIVSAISDNDTMTGVGYAAGATQICVGGYAGTAPIYLGSNITIGADPTLYEVTAITGTDTNPSSLTLKAGIGSAINDNDLITGAGYAAGVTTISVDGFGGNTIPIIPGSNITISGTQYTVLSANDSLNPTSIILKAALGSAVVENAAIAGAGYDAGVTTVSVDGWVDSLGNANTIPIALGSNITIAGTLYTVNSVDSGTAAQPTLITLTSALSSAVAENAAIVGAGYDTGVTTISVDGMTGTGAPPLPGSYIRVAGDLNLHEVVSVTATSITIAGPGLTNPIVDNAIVTGAGYATGTASIRVDGFTGGVVAGNWVTIDGETDGFGNLISHQLAAGSSSTRLYFTDTLTNDIADNAVVTRVLAPNLTTISVTGFNGTIEVGTYITIAGDLDPISGNLVLHKVISTLGGSTPTSITFETATSNPVAVNAAVVAGRSLSLSNSILAENKAILTTGGKEIWQRSDIYVRSGGGVLVDSITGVGNDHNIIGAFNALQREVTYTYETTVPAPGTNTPVYYERTWNLTTNTWNTPVPVYEFVPSSTTTNTGYDWTDNVTNIVGYIPPAVASLPVPPTYISVNVTTAANLPASLKLSPYSTPATPFIYLAEKNPSGALTGKWFRVDASGTFVTFDPSLATKDGLYTSTGTVFGGGTLANAFTLANGNYQADTYTALDPATPVIIINPGTTTTDVTNPRYGIVADLKLDFTLNYNGALTRTLRVLDGSVAKDHGIVVARPAGRFSDATFFTDQRGASRGAIGTDTNIGAFDYVDTITVSSGADSATPRVGFDFANYKPLWDSTTLTLREAVKLADDGSHIRFKDTWQKNGTVYVDPSTVLYTGNINNPGGYAVGATSINVDGFSNALAVGTYIKIAGDTNYYRVQSATSTLITLNTGLVNAVVGNEAIDNFNAVTVANELNSSGNLIINLVGGELPVTRSVTIDGMFDWNEVNTSGTVGTVTATHYDSIAQLTANANNRLFNLKTAMSTVGISNFIMTGTGNVTGNGAGIFSSANLWLDNVTIQNCKAVARTATSGDGLGGGIYSDQGYLQMINSTIGSYTTTGGNTAAFGGGIYVSGRNSANNVVLDIGHMIVDGVDSYGGSTIVGNIANNTTNGNGGGVYLLAGNANVIYSTIGNNRTVSDGGGIYVATTGSLAMTNSTVANNTAGRHGGGIAFNSYNTLNLDYTTIANNQVGMNISASVYLNPFATGGGIYMNSGTLALSNSILAQNFAGKFSPTTTLIQSKSSPVAINSTYLNLGIHDDLYTYAGTNTITNSVYGATGGGVAVPTSITNQWIQTIDDWTAFYSVSGTTVTAKLDVKLTDNGGHSKTVYVFDPSYFQKAAVGTIVYDQTQLEEFTIVPDYTNGRITSGAYENSVDKVLYYENGAITKGRDGGSHWISANGVVLSEADGVLNANKTIFVFADTTVVDINAIPHVLTGVATLNYNWTINGPDWTKTYRSHIALMNNAYFTVAAFVQGTTTPTILDGQIVLNDYNPVLPAPTAETATLELQTSSLNDTITSTSRNTMLSVNPGASATSNTTVIYSSTSSTQRVLAVDAIYSGAMEYDNLTLSGATGITLSYKNAWGPINVNKVLNVGNGNDNVKLTVLNTAGGGNADLNILGSTLNNFGQIVAANIIIDGTTITEGGIINATQYFDMTNVTYTDKANGNITPTLAKIAAGIDLTMTDVSITGLASPVTLFTAGGDVYFNGGTIDLTNVSIAAGSGKKIYMGNSSHTDINMMGNVTLSGPSNGKTVTIMMADNNIVATGLNNNIYSNGLNVNTSGLLNNCTWLGTIQVAGPANSALTIDIGAQNFTIAPTGTTSNPTLPLTSLTLGLDKLTINTNNEFKVVTTGTVVSTAGGSASAAIAGKLSLSGKIALNNTFANIGDASSTLELGGTIAISTANITMANSLSLMGTTTVNTTVGFVPVTVPMTITSSSGNLSIGTVGTFTGNTNNLDLTAAGSVAIGNVTGVKTLTVAAGTNFTLTNSITAPGDVLISAGGTISAGGKTLTATGNVTFGTITLPNVSLNNITVIAGSAKTILFNGDLTLTGNTTIGSISSTVKFTDTNVSVTGSNNNIVTKGLDTVGWLPLKHITVAAGGALKLNISTQNLVISDGQGTSTATLLSLGVDRLVVANTGRLELVTTGTNPITAAVVGLTAPGVSGTLALNGKVNLNDSTFTLELNPAGTLEFDGEVTITKDATLIGGLYAATVNKDSNLLFIGNVKVDPLVTGTTTITSASGSITVGSNQTSGAKFTGSGKALILDAAVDITLGNVLGINDLTVTAGNNIILNNSVTVTGTLAGTGDVIFISLNPVQVQKAYTSAAMTTLSPIVITAGTTFGIITSPGFDSVAGGSSELQLSAGSNVLRSSNIGPVNMSNSLTLTKGGFASGSIILTGNGSNLITKAPLDVTGSIDIQGNGKLENSASVTGAVNHVGPVYPIGTTTIAVDGFNAALTVGSFITIAGDPNSHQVTASTLTSVTFTIPTQVTVADNVIITASGLVVSGDISVAGGTTTSLLNNLSSGTISAGSITLDATASFAGSVNVGGPVTGAVNKPGSSYAIGTTTIAVDGFAGAITNGSYITIAGDPNTHLVTNTPGGATPTSITFSTPLVNAIADNAVITRVVNTGVTTISVTGFASQIQVGSFITIAGDAYPHRVTSIVGGTGPTTSITLSEGLKSPVAVNAAITVNAPPASLTNAGAVNVIGAVTLNGGNLTNSMRFTADSIANTFGGDLTNSNFGNITNSGTGVTGGMTVAGNITLVSTGAINNTGTISATDYNLAAGNLTTSSSLKADTISFSGAGNLITSGTVSVKAAPAGIDITLNGGSFTNTGTMTSVDLITLNGSSSLNSNSGTLTANTINMASGGLNNNSGTLTVNTAINMTTGTLTNKAILSVPTITITGNGSIVNSSTLKGLGTAGLVDINLNGGGSLTNTSTMNVDALVFTLGGALNNNSGTLTANTIGMVTGTLNNKATLAGNTITFTGNGSVINSSTLKGQGTAGLIDINLNGGGSLTNTGTMAFVNALNLTGAGALNNNTGTLTANTITMANGTLTNKAILNVTNGVTGLHITGTGDLANTGTLKANVITLENGNLTNSGSGTIAEIAGGAVYITPTGAINTSPTGAVNHVGGYLAATTTMDVDGFTGSNLLVGSTFKIAGETGTPTHTVTATTGGATPTITFTTALASAVADNAVITATGYAAATTSINVDGFTGSPLQVGSTFKIAGETGAPTHTVTATTGGATPTITFTTALASNVADNASITTTGYAATTTTINVSGFTSAIANGSYVTIAGDPNAHLVTGTTGGDKPTSITFTTPLVNAVSNSAVVSTVSTITLNGSGKTLTNSGTSIIIDNIVLDGSNLDSSKTLTVNNILGIRNTSGALTPATLKTSATALATTAGTLDLQRDAIMSQGRLTVTNFNFNGGTYFQMNNTTAVTTLEITGNYVAGTSGLNGCDATHYFVTAGTSKFWIKPTNTATQNVFLTDKTTNPVIEIDLTGATATSDKLVGLSTFKNVTVNGQYDGTPASPGTLYSAVNRVWNVTRTAGDTTSLTVRFYWNASEEGTRLNNNAKLFYSSGSSWGNGITGGLNRTFDYYENTTLKSSGSYSVSNYPIVAMNDDSSSIGAQLEELKEQFIDAIFGTQEAIVEPQVVAQAQAKSEMENMFSQMANRGNLMERNKLFKTDIDLSLEELLAV